MTAAPSASLSGDHQARHGLGFVRADCCHSQSEVSTTTSIGRTRAWVRNWRDHDLQRSYLGCLLPGRDKGWLYGRHWAQSCRPQLG